MSINTQFDQQHIWHPYTSSPSTYPHHLVKSAQGVYLTFENNKKIIDGMSSWWSAIHGYNHPKLNQVIKDQTNKMAHIMFGGLTHQPAINLAKTLINLTSKSLDKVFFSDSGSVAVEVAMKMALQYQRNIGQGQKTKFITPLGGYYGDTFGAMSVCDPNNGFHHLFTEVLPKQYFVKQPNELDAIQDLTKTLAKYHQYIAAMILEPIVQGAGGMKIYPAEYLKQARTLCSKYGVLLIIDEIATGFGRTGKLFAYQWADIEADILCLGKTLTGGYLSLGATLTSEKIAKKIGILLHGPTFMANPLATAVASKSIELLLASNWQANISRIETIFKQELLPLQQHPKVKEVRILGAIAVLEMVQDIEVETLQNSLLAQGVWLRPFGKLLYSMPAFNINNQQLKQLTKAMIIATQA